MTRICPKCSYARQATDSNPDWQCPSCHVAYARFGAEAAPANSGRPVTPLVTSGGSSSANPKWIFLAVAIGVGVLASKSMWHAKTAPHVTARSAQPAVVLYGTEWCGYCAATREFFAQNGIQYTELDIEKSSQGYDEHKRLGGNGVPLVVIGDEVIHGYNEASMRVLLKPWLKGT